MVETGASLRVLFFGTPEFAVPTLQALLDSRHQVVGVVTQPDRPRGRGQKVTDAPVKMLALQAGLPVAQPETLKDASVIDHLAAFNSDIGVVAAFGKILSERMLSLPRGGMVNVHASLLPRFRGAAPVHRAVIAGEPETGLTIMRVVKALDAGPMLARITRPIGPDETSEDVERDLARLGARLLITTLDDWSAGRVVEEAQDDRLATYAHRLTKGDGIVDWDWPAERVHNLIRGLHPWPHAFSFLNGRRLILRRSSWAPESLVDAAPGTVLQADGDRLRIATGSGVLNLLQIQPEGKRPLSVREFLSGHPVHAGERFERQ